MKENKLTITIKRPIQEVFDFVLNPDNTSKWIPSIVSEVRSSGPIGVGTEYRNVNHEGKWSTYLVTEYSPINMFVMTSEDKNYHVRYTLKSEEVGQTVFEYYEWVDKGELEGFFTQDVMVGLKKLLERE